MRAEAAHAGRDAVDIDDEVSALLTRFSVVLVGVAGDATRAASVAGAVDR